MAVTLIKFDLCSLIQHSVIGASFEVRSTIVQQESRWTTYSVGPLKILQRPNSPMANKC